MLTLKIAWRNLFRHKGKSFVIGTILFIGALILTAGNAVIMGANKGIENNLVNGFVGNLVLVSKTEEKENVFFTPMGKPIKIIKDYPAVKEVLAKQDYIEKFLPLNRGVAMILSETSDINGTMLIGTSFEDYRRMFGENVYTIEGRLLKNNERGLLISESTRDRIYKTHNFWLLPEGGEIVEENLSKEAKEHRQNLKTQNELILMGMGDGSFDMDIKIPVIGIIKYKTLDSLWGILSFIDIESDRECFGYFTAENNAVTLSDSQQTLLNIENPEDLFGSDTGSTVDTGNAAIDLSVLKEDKAKTISVNTDQGAFQIVSIKLKPGISMKSAITKLNKVIAETGIDGKILTWDQAAGQVADIAILMQRALIGFVILIFLVAIIVIMNTLSMAAIERTTELGMMRAVGAQKLFVGNLFFSETAMLSFVFGGAGIICGILVVLIVSAFNIPAGDNQALYFIFGGDTFHPIITTGSILLGFFQLAIVSLLAVIYPILVARKITPIEAITRD